MAKYPTISAEQILDVAKDTMVRDGYQNFTIRRVALSCGVSIGSIYNFFPSKQQLVLKVMMMEWERLLDDIQQEMPKAVSAFEKLMVIHRHLVRVFCRDHALWVHGLEETHRVHSEFIQKMIRTIQDVIANKPVENSYVRAEAIWRLMLSYCLLPAREDHEIEKVLPFFIQFDNP